MSTPDQFSVLAGILPEPLLLVSDKGQILAVNQPVLELLGVERESLVEQSLFEFVDLTITPHDKLIQFLKNCAKSRQMVLGSLNLHNSRGQSLPYRCEGAVMQPWTRETPASIVLRLKPKESASQQFALLTQKIDQLAKEILERKRIEEALRAGEAHLRLALQAAKMGTWEVDISTGALHLSEEFKDLLDLPPDTTIHYLKQWQTYLHTDDRERIEQAFKQAISGKGEYKVEYRILWSDRSVHWLASKGHIIRDLGGRPVKAIGVTHDITEAKHREEAHQRSQERLRHETLHDALTGLPNRLLLMERVGQAIRRAKRRENYCFAVLFIDLDRFKIINDSLGHLVGDRLLMDIADKLKQCIRSSDTVARLGGDEFVIFIDDLSQEREALKVAERVIAELKTPFFIEGREVFTTASIGIAFNSSIDETETDLLRNADLAMYSAKARGKSCYALFHPTLHAQSQTHLELETNLRLALERREFLMHYQPIVSLKTLTIDSLEALIRWQNPQGEFLYPTDFLSVAEETGLIVPLGQWAIYESCRQMAMWRQHYPQVADLKICLNLSNKQLQSPNFIEQIDAILQQTGLPATCLKLEITESSLSGCTDFSISLLLRLKERGIQVSIDDFGTGHSFLSYLHHLPVDIVKIDRSFVARMGDDRRIIESLITLAHHLEIEIVAEGIETPEQFEQLQELGCEYGQGFFFSQPIAGQSAEQLFSQRIFSVSHLRLPSAF